MLGVLVWSHSLHSQWVCTDCCVQMQPGLLIRPPPVTDEETIAQEEQPTSWVVSERLCWPLAHCPDGPQPAWPTCTFVFSFPGGHSLALNHPSSITNNTSTWRVPQDPIPAVPSLPPDIYGELLVYFG